MNLAVLERMNLDQYCGVWLYKPSALLQTFRDGYLANVKEQLSVVVINKVTGHSWAVHPYVTTQHIVSNIHYLLTLEPRNTSHAQSHKYKKQR